MSTLKVKIIMGSVRPGRFSEHSAKWIAGIMNENKAIEVEILDLKDYPLALYANVVSPSMGNGKHEGEVESAWAAKIAEADAYVFVTPEYNRSIPGALKNAIDYLYPEWNKKPFGIVTHGSVGGARAAEHLRTIGVELQMASVRAGVHIVAPWILTDEKGLKAGALDGYKQAADGMIEQLVWWGNALKAARTA
jgi:NAD(P)H-dependent FMN reductase